MDQWLTQSEDHYAKYFPTHWNDRPIMDVILTQWGFPVPKETSDIGSTLRLAFVLAKAWEWATEKRVILGVRKDTQERKCIFDVLEDPPGKERLLSRDDELLSSTDPFDYCNLIKTVRSVKDELTMRAKDEPCVSRRKEHAHISNLNTVGENRSYEFQVKRKLTQWSALAKAAPLLVGPGRPLQLIRVDTATLWQPPQYRVVEYPELIGTPMRRFGFVHRRNGAAHSTRRGDVYKPVELSWKPHVPDVSHHLSIVRPNASSAFLDEFSEIYGEPWRRSSESRCPLYGFSERT